MQIFLARVLRLVGNIGHGAIRLGTPEEIGDSAQMANCLLDYEAARPGQAYNLDLPDDTRYVGDIDGDGKTIKAGTSASNDIKLTLLDKDDWGRENINVWHHEMDKNWG